MTHDEALTKWCPHSRVRDTVVSAAINRTQPASADTRCLGAGCMAWRAVGNAGWCGMSGDKGVL